MNNLSANTIENTSSGKTSIALNKAKLGKLIFGAFCFVVVGIWMATIQAAGDVADLPFQSSTLPRVIGIVGILFFGFCGLIAIRKMLDNKPGLIITAIGFDDNSSGAAAGFIPWSDVTAVTTYAIAGQKILVVKVRDLKKYNQRGNTFKRFINRMNTRLCGSPIAIAPNTLDASLDELLALFQSHLRQ